MQISAENKARVIDSMNVCKQFNGMQTAAFVEMSKTNRYCTVKPNYLLFANLTHFFIYLFITPLYMFRAS